MIRIVRFVPEEVAVTYVYHSTEDCVFAADFLPILDEDCQGFCVGGFTVILVDPDGKLAEFESIAPTPIDRMACSMAEHPERLVGFPVLSSIERAPNNVKVQTTADGFTLWFAEGKAITRIAWNKGVQFLCSHDELVGICVGGIRRLNEVRKSEMLGGLWGAVVGDALGVPVEFKSREESRRSPVTGMTGYGTFNLPPGSWSDDSSLLLCTIESLLKRFDLEDMGRLFVRWYKEGYWTPWGTTFDVGNGTAEAIERLLVGVEAKKAGGASEMDNDDGSLMRIFPVALFNAAGCHLDDVHEASAITHRHPRSMIACGIYSFMAQRILHGEGLVSAYQQTIDMVRRVYTSDDDQKELPYFERILSGRIAELKEDEISSSGYVIDTLEAALWSVLTTRSFEEAVLRAVNLGSDTDTTASVAGGLAGLFYGFDAIPCKWVNTIARHDEIGALFEGFVEKVWGFTIVADLAAREEGACFRPISATTRSGDGY